jgi:hypothetical protein
LFDVREKEEVMKEERRTVLKEEGRLLKEKDGFIEGQY